MAADEFLTSLLDRCTRFAQRFVGDHDTAREVAAEAFSRFLDHQELFDDDDHMVPWTLRVTRNLAVDVLRQRAREIALESEEPVGSDAESEIVLRMAVDEAIRGLSEQQRNVVIQRYLLDRSQADVAASLRMHPGTVATHVNRALNKLRILLSDNQTQTHTEDHPLKIISAEQAAGLIGTDHTITARIVGGLPGGSLAVDIGVPAIYRSRGQLGRRPRDSTVGTTFQCVVLDLKDDGTPVVTEPLSGDDADTFARASNQIEGLLPGQRYPGQVESVVPFGAFVIFNGLRGLVHISELDPATTLVVDQDVEVEVLDTDFRLGRISLRLGSPPHSG